MSEPQITHSDTTMDLRKRIEAVLERHGETYLTNQPDDEDRCVVCDQLGPCDAYTLATALLEAVTALEWYGDKEHYHGPGHYMAGREIDIDEGYRATTGLATIAAKLDGGDDDN